MNKKKIMFSANAAQTSSMILFYSDFNMLLACLPAAKLSSIRHDKILCFERMSLNEKLFSNQFWYENEKKNSICQTEFSVFWQIAFNCEDGKYV